ncbi:MAG: hypothetical protein Q9196_004927 [Gyalolechia fulgens]
MATFANNNWTGRLRHAPVINIGILLASVATFGLAVSYASASINTPMDDQALIWMRPRPANRYAILNETADQTREKLLTDLGCSKIIVYSAFMPFFSMLQSVLDLSFYYLVSLYPIYSLAISSVYFLGWLVQWSLWIHCESSGVGSENAGQGETCWQVNLDRPENSYVPFRSSEGVVNGRIGMGTVVIVFYLAYWVMSLMAVLRNRRGSATGYKLGAAEMR